MSKNYFKTYPFTTAGFFALPLIVLIFVMELYNPTTAPEGFKSFIIAFEFAKTPDQILTLFNGLSADDLARIDTGTYIDYVFLVCYVLFLIVFISKMIKVFSAKWLLIGIPLSIIILLADVYENVLLLQVTEIYTPISSDNLTPVLKILHKITWVKWSGLSVLFAFFSIVFLGKNQGTRLEAIVCAIPVLIGFFALSNNPTILSWFTVSIFMVFFVLVFFSFTYKMK